MRPFPQLFLGVPRACLGKMIVLGIKTAPKTGVFRTERQRGVDITREALDAGAVIVAGAVVAICSQQASHVSSVKQGRSCVILPRK